MKAEGQGFGAWGEARVIETGSVWMRIAGCLGVATSGAPLCYEDAAERNTPRQWQSVLQDRVFVRQATSGGMLRDFCAVLRMGKRGARRAAEGPERIAATGDMIRAYRFKDARGRRVTVAANLGRTDAAATVEGIGAVKIPAMDVEVFLNV